MRAYVPLLTVDLAEVAATRRLPSRPAYAVTEALRALDPLADEEDLEFEAMCQALDAARALGRGRRVIASADVPEAMGSGPSALLDHPVSLELADVVSFHVEESEGEVGAGYDDLLWYDVTELDEVVRLRA